MSTSIRKLLIFLSILLFFGLGLETFSPIFSKIDQGLPFEDIKFKPEFKSFEFTITCYSSSPDETDNTPFITASGKSVFEVKNLAASNFFPLGTKIKIPELYGEKIFTIEDRLNPKYNDVIDIWKPTKKLAKQCGVKKAKVIVVSQ